MKEYVQLSIDAEAYYSGNTYYEEVFLPKELWEKIKNDVQMYTYLSEFDGKHSEVKVEIEIDEWNEKQLQTYEFKSNDSDNLFNHVYEHLDSNVYPDGYLEKIQQDVLDLSQVETLKIKINKNKKEEVLSLLKNYLV